MSLKKIKQQHKNNIGLSIKDTQNYNDNVDSSFKNST